MLPSKAHKEHHHSGDTGDELLKGIVMGAVLGAGILWLMGTESGKKVKKQLEDTGGEMLAKVKHDVPEDPDEVTLEDTAFVPASTVPLVKAKSSRSATTTARKRFFTKRK